MKWKVTKAAGAPTQAAEISVEIDIPDQLRSRMPSIGETFQIKARQSLPGDKLDSAGVPWTSLHCMFVGDGKSLKVGNRVVRLARRPEALKKGNYRLRVAAGGICADETRHFQLVRPVTPLQNNIHTASGIHKAPMTGKAIKVLVNKGTLVEEGDVLLVIEAMKMENQIRSECAGIVNEVKIQAGQSVTVDELLVIVVPNHSSETGAKAKK